VVEATVETVVGGTAVGLRASVGSGAAVAGAPHAASKTLIATNTNSKGRTNLIISIFLLYFYTLKSYQEVFKVKGRTG
jgi:hypothetical protein